jgi:hypothetical protein
METDAAWLSSILASVEELLETNRTTLLEILDSNLSKYKVLESEVAQELSERKREYNITFERAVNCCRQELQMKLDEQKQAVDQELQVSITNLREFEFMSEEDELSRAVCLLETNFAIACRQMEVEHLILLQSGNEASRLRKVHNPTSNNEITGATEVKRSSGIVDRIISLFSPSSKKARFEVDEELSEMDE